jgi:hypothetical protein
MGHPPFRSKRTVLKIKTVSLIFSTARSNYGAVPMALLKMRPTLTMKSMMRFFEPSLSSRSLIMSSRSTPSHGRCQLHAPLHVSFVNLPAKQTGRMKMALLPSSKHAGPQRPPLQLHHREQLELRQERVGRGVAVHLVAQPASRRQHPPPPHTHHTGRGRVCCMAARGVAVHPREVGAAERRLLAAAAAHAGPAAAAPRRALSSKAVRGEPLGAQTPQLRRR